jgi:hypothetical protein
MVCSATVYSTCIFCHTGLGSNQSIEHFPVGRRLAFDAAKGRLWAVCRSCERWNLSPIDERWEAIEECERLFRDTKLRVSTDNIGLARVKEGTTLVRVGDPQRPEMAAWRYGDQFSRRRVKHAALVVSVTAASAAVFQGFFAAVPPEWYAGGFLIGAVPPLVVLARGKYVNRTTTRLPVRGAVLELNAAMVKRTRLHSNEAQGFALEVQHKPLLWPGEASVRGGRTVIPNILMAVDQPRILLHGDEALSAARKLLPRINRAGASAGRITEAVRVLETARSAEHIFGSTAFVHRSAEISALAPPIRLALEMSLHEQDERRALEGELSLLEDRWREAEEVAAISDDMFLPAGVNAMFSRLKGGGL